MVINSALCFVLIALALLTERMAPARGRSLQRVLGTVVFLFSTAIFSQYLTGMDLGLDWPGSRNPGTTDPFPGRMPGLSALGFMLCGLVLSNMHSVTSLRGGLAIQALSVLVIVNGLIGIAGHLIPLSLFYSNYVFGQMALSTDFGFIIAGTVFCLVWSRDDWYSKRRLIQRNDQRIVATGVLTLGLAVCTAMLAGFVVMVKQVEHLAGNSQLDLLKSSVTLFQLNLDLRMDQVTLVADRPVMREALDKLNRNPGDKETLARLRMNMPALLANGFSALEIADPEGKPWMSVGKFVPEESMGVALRSRHPATLMWQDGFVLRTQIPMQVDGRTVAVFKAEQRLHRLAEMLNSAHMLEESGEVAICGRLAAEFTCFPQRRIMQPYRVPYSAQLPMGLALAGNTGVLVGRDYRGENVVAAHGSIGDLGLGMVVKMDTAELYLPLRHSMYQVILLMVLVLLIGGWVLYRSVSPLARRLESSENRLQQALEGSRISLWDWDMKSGSVYLSEKWAELLGEPAHPMTMQMDKLQAMVHPEDLPTLLEHLRLVIKGVENAYDLEHRIRLRDGRERWIRSRGKVAERGADGRVLRMVGTNVDISRRKQAEFLLAHQASHDALTGLPNRLFFPDRLEQAMARSRRQKTLMAVMYLDIDRFKGINDTLGHEAGDALLKEFAARISAVLRTTDTAIRLGGDEFVIILEGLGSRENGAAVAEKIVASMRTPFSVGKGTLRITTSAGLCYYQGDASLNGDALLRKADEAMYQAKAAGRNNVKFAG